MSDDKFQGRHMIVCCIKWGFRLRLRGFWIPAGDIWLGESTVNLALEARRQNIVNGLACFQKLLVFDQFAYSVDEQLNEFSLKSRKIFLHVRRTNTFIKILCR